ncbi:HEPN domain-containing protein [Cronobacter sakazakii]
MSRFDNAMITFQHAMARAKEMISLYDALCALRKTQPENDDALRSAYFQIVSSFDFFAHEIAAIEARYRFENGIRTRNIILPMEIMTIQDKNDRINAAELSIRNTNSFKAFVDPGKLAEMLACYCKEPWKKICEEMNAGKELSEQKTMQELKGNLKSIWKRRNRIAHEADVDPTLAGVSLWPIYKEDPEFTMAFIKDVANQLPKVIAVELPEEAEDKQSEEGEQ